MKRPMSAAAAAVLLCAFLGARSGSSLAAEPYKINVLVPRSGNGAFLGDSQTAALKVVEQVVNKRGGVAGRPLQFTFLDDQSNPQIAVQLTNSVIAQGAPLMFGSTLVASCNAEAPLIKAGPVTYCFSPAVHPPPDSNMFTAGTSTTDMLAASLRYFRERGLTKLAVLASTDATGQDVDDNIASLLARPENKALAVVAHEHYNASDVSVTAQIERIKSSGAQLLIAWTVGAALATIFKGMQADGLDVPVLSTPGNMTYVQMRQYAAFLPKQLYFPGSPAFAPEQLPNGPQKRAVETYLDAFRSAGIRPDQGHLFVWDPVLIAVAAINKLGPNMTAAQLKGFINGYRGVGVFGPYDFAAVPQRGIGVDSVIVVRWDPQKETWVGVSKRGGAVSG